jgi:predicted DNA-binding transcriptional regulator AlpA
MAGNVLGFVAHHRKAFLTPDELAAFLRVNRCTLQQWRNQGQGPRFLKLGHHTIRYLRSSVLAYLESTASPPAPGRHRSRVLRQLQAGGASK